MMNIVFIAIDNQAVFNTKKGMYSKHVLFKVLKGRKRLQMWC